MNKEQRLLKWFITGNVGESSRTMAFIASDIELSNDEINDSFSFGLAHPHDSGDFERCLKLIEAVPEVKDSFDVIAKISPSWAALIENWDDIETTFNNEYDKSGKRNLDVPSTSAQIHDIVSNVKN